MALRGPGTLLYYVMRKRYSIESNEIDRLRQEVEKAISRRMSTPADYTFLSEKLVQTGCGYVSPTTLKRLWGYINDTRTLYTPGNFTLRILCNLLGFRDMEDFIEASAALQSMEYTGHFVESRSLGENVEVILTWAPNRRCVLRHINSSLFEVTEVENSRLRKGDMVECVCFTQNAPAYFSRVFRKDSAPMTYVAGTANGIRFNVNPSGSPED